MIRAVVRFAEREKNANTRRENVLKTDNNFAGNGGNPPVAYSNRGKPLSGGNGLCPCNSYSTIKIRWKKPPNARTHFRILINVWSHTR